MKSAARFHRRLGVQLGLTVALVTSVVFGFTVWFVVNQERQTLTAELTRRLLVESHSLSLAAAAPLLRYDPELGLHPLIQKALAETPDLVDLIVLDATRTVQGHRDMLEVGKPYEAPESRQPVPIDGLRPDEKVWLDDAGLLVIEQPVDHLDKTIGWLVLRASRAGIEATVQSALQRLLVVGALGTLAAIVAVLLIVSMNLRPLGALRRGVQRLGSGDLRARVHVRSRNELGLFAELVNSMADGLETAQRERIQKERVDHELEIARELQEMLLPKSPKPAPGYRLSAHYTPALEVSGDYYDVMPLDEHHVAFAAADVSGKGVPGLVIMSMLRTALQSFAAPGRDPRHVLVAASRMLHRKMRRGMFVTCLYGVLDARNHIFRYASAGHCPPLLFGPRGLQDLDAKGKPMGMFPETLFTRSLKTRTVRLDPGEGLLLYTDGLVEALDARGNQLGLPAVHRQVAAWLRDPRQDLVEVLRAAVEKHRGPTPPSDDLTMVAIQRFAAQARTTQGVTA